MYGISLLLVTCWENTLSKKAFERTENAQRTESVELQKAAGEIENSQLKERVQEQEALLAVRQAQLETLEGKVETQQKTIDDLTFQKSKLEHDVNQYCTKLEISVKDKAASEMELSHTQLLIQQSEAKWSLAQQKIEDLLKKINDDQDLKQQSPKSKRRIHLEESTEGRVQSQVTAKANNLAQQPLASDTESTVNSELELSAVRENNSRVVAVLQQKEEELVLIQKRAEVAEEKAQRYKQLLNDSNNRLRKLQMDMENERNNMRQKSEDLQQEAMNMRKSINELQEEIRSLQRTKSSLEQSSFFQSTEIEGLKEQLKSTQGDMLKKSSLEQENIHKIDNLEEEVASKQAVVDQMTFKCNELTRIHVSSESDVKGLQIQTEALEKDRSFAYQKVKSLKGEIESWKQQLQTAEEEYNLVKRSEQASQLKCKHLQAELDKSELVASQLQKSVDELKQIHMEMETNQKNVTAQLDQVTMQIDSKDQQIKIFKSQAEGTKSQVKIIEDELSKKSQNSFELQMKLQDYSEEVRRMTELQQNIQTLNSKIGNYENEISTLKSELQSVFAEKNFANQKIHMYNSEINDLNTLLKKRNAELQRESEESQKHQNKIKALEDELYTNKHSITGLTSSSEEVTENLKQEMNAIHNDKRAADRNVENLNVKISELSSSVQRTKDELLKETRERKDKDSKILQMESELQKYKETVKEVTSSSDKSRSNLQHENSILKREKAESLEKSISLGTEVRLLKENLKRAQKEAEQKQNESSVLKLKSQQMEEQLEKCTDMLEELKSKLELQKEGYERQLLLVQTEVEKKLILLQSEISSQSGNSNQQSHSAELAEMLNKYFRQDVKKIKTVHQTTVETKHQSDKVLQMQIEMDQLQQERWKLEHELLKATLQTSQLEEDQFKLNSKVSALQGLCNEKSNESAKGTDSTLTLKENEALRDQIESYAKEVKHLQEKLLMLEVRIITENQGMNKQEFFETSRHNVWDNNAASVKTEQTAMQKMVPSYESKYNMEDESRKIKVSAEHH
ncbi:uncharacterized protein [Pseudochaenichthys georgianus]|uniref:uncharacterized protein n=1 Tax=Pseudochaenichthys georgianus TaxID=52239 RepID=UPI0039C32403